MQHLYQVARQRQAALLSSDDCSSAACTSLHREPHARRKIRSMAGSSVPVDQVWTRFTGPRPVQYHDPAQLHRDRRRWSSAAPRALSISARLASSFARQDSPLPAPSPARSAPNSISRSSPPAVRTSSTKSAVRRHDHGLIEQPRPIGPHPHGLHDQDQRVNSARSTARSCRTTAVLSPTTSTFGPATATAFQVSVEGSNRSEYVKLEATIRSRPRARNVRSPPVVVLGDEVGTAQPSRVGTEALTTTRHALLVPRQWQGGRPSLFMRLS